MEEKRPTLTDEQLLEAVHNWVVRLCNTGGRAWTLRVPVDHDRDPDILISELCRRFEEKAKLKASFDEVVRQRDRYRAALEVGSQMVNDLMVARRWIGFSMEQIGANSREIREKWIDKARQAGEGSDDTTD